MTAGDVVFMVRRSHAFHWRPRRRKRSPLGWGVHWLWWFVSGRPM